MNLNQLHYFSVTARHQHFTRAAEELFISQPSLSYAISSLEEELGVSLFQKKGRNVELTQHGKLFLTHVERALSEIQQGRQALSRMIAETENNIHIAALSTCLGPVDLPDLLQRFTALPQNADVRFTFTQCSDDTMLDGLKSMKYDVIFPPDDADDPDIIADPLLTCRLVAIMPKEHPLATQTTISLQTLESHPLLILNSSRSGLLLQQHLPNCNITCRVSDHHSLLSLAAAHFGIAVCMPTQETQASGLVSLPISSPDLECTIRVAYKRNRYITPALERFIQSLKSQMCKAN